MTNDEKLIFACGTLSQRLKVAPASFVLDSPILTTLTSLALVRDSNEFIFPKSGIKQPKEETLKSSKMTIAPFINSLTPFDFYYARNLVVRANLASITKAYVSLYLSEIIQNSSGSVSYFHDVFDGNLDGILSKPRVWLLTFADMVLDEQKQEDRKLYVQPEYSLYGRW